ncbi:MAG: glycoside hydrolase family 16 protein, partial [Armatimonadota bacterium]|nr:glycoside hydrolase family 16 protein [Armatimonadota bacterium]
LIFADDFQGESLNWKVWASQAGPSGHILSSRWPENVVVRDGVLRLVTRKERRAGQDWTTANIWVKDRRFGYGYYEARYRYGAAPGLNNAFWLWKDLPGRAPGLVEIDINEGHYPDRINTNLHLHNDGRGRHYAVGQVYRAAGADLSRDFHTYGLEWNEQELVYYFDGRPIRRLPNHIAFDGDMNLLLSTAVLAWAGRVTDALDGTSMDVDWVRVYRRTATQAPAVPQPASLAGQTEAQPGGALRTLVHEEFEGSAPGTLPAGWRVLGGEPRVEASVSGMECFRMARHGNLAFVEAVRVADPGEGGKHSLRLYHKEDVVLLPFPVQRQRVEVSFRVLLASPGSVLRAALVSPELEVAAGRGWVPLAGPYLGWHDLGYLGWYGEEAWHFFAAHPAGVWTTARVTAEPASRRFAVYLGDGSLPAALGYFRAPQEALGGLLFAKGEGRYGPEPVWIDNVRVRGR